MQSSTGHHSDPPEDDDEQQELGRTGVTPCPAPLSACSIVSVSGARPMPLPMVTKAPIRWGISRNGPLKAELTVPACGPAHSAFLIWMPWAWVLQSRCLPV